MYLPNVVCFTLLVFVKSEENKINTTFSILVSDDNKTESSVSVNNTNLTERTPQNNVTIERITQPIIKPTEKNTIEKPKENQKILSDFKPSPLVEMNYGLGRFVKPAFSEAKSASFANYERRIPEEFNWNQIKFPEVQTIKDHPYPFVKSNENDPYYDNTNNNKQDNYIGLQPPLIGYLNHGEDYKNPQTFTKVEKYGVHDEERYKPDYTDLEILDKPYGLESQFPWKKILKFLTTFVPLGILLSALVPNVISITPINSTQGRARIDNDETETKTKMKLIYSSKLTRDLKKKRCDHRILCELLLGAGYSKNPEENAEHLLETYVEKEQEIAEKTEELKRVLFAVSKGSCEQFKCDAFKET